MKKNFIIIIFVMFIFSGCSNQESGSSLSDTSASNNTSNTSSSLVEDTSGVDVDLTKLSSTMVYAEVYNMMTYPDKYMGKTVKMSGPYTSSYYEETKQYYHYIIIEDATACCQQGLEFIWEGNHNYPDDYPKDGTKVEATGTFGKYDELGQTYYYIAINDLVVK